MIPGSSKFWQAELRTAITDYRELLQSLGLKRCLDAGTEAAIRQFPLLVTRYFASLMEYGNPDDPLLRQVLPLPQENELHNGFVPDPVGDTAAHKGTGLLHKYHGRALLVTTGACAIHCRYCFRRHYSYADAALSRSDIDDLVRNLRATPEVCEVILSGGDPLTLSDARIAELITLLAGVPTLTRLRIHTRLPILLPSRITQTLIASLAQSRLQTSMVLHVNHPKELAPALVNPLWRLRTAGITLLNQAVLLRGVNDHIDVLTHLSARLFEFGVLPYYLHRLDRVQGAAHFAIADGEIAQLATGLRERLPGYLVPRIVYEQPGAAAKLPIQQELIWA